MKGASLALLSSREKSQVLYFPNAFAKVQENSLMGFFKVLWVGETAL